MSSLAASRADGFYFPPDYDPAKHGSLNQYNGQHPLRERASRLDQGILVIRFEMPFNVWCGKCNHLIGKGVRFNADKKQIGNYHSTKIWSFTMNTPCCGNRIEVQTDPKNTEYVVVSGGRRKVETWTAQNAETIELPEKEEEKFAPRVDDTFARLEKGEADMLKARELNSRVAELYQDSNDKYKNDYQINKDLRRQNRAKRDLEKDLEKRRMSLGLSSDVPLLPESEEDGLEAASIEFGNPHNYKRNWQQKRKAIKSQSIFHPTALTKLGSKLDRFGQKLSERVSRHSFDEPAERPLQALSRQSPKDSVEENLAQSIPQPGAQLKRQTPDSESFADDDDFKLDPKTDEDLIKPAGTHTLKLAANEAWPDDGVKCRKLDADPDLWVCSRAASAGMAKFFQCPFTTIYEDKEMDCSQAPRDKQSRSCEGQRPMRKMDKSKCRQQLSSSKSLGALDSRKSVSLAHCQQKLKKTSLSDKIAAALKRH